MNVGDRIGDYEITSILGAGGMGQVYKVRNVLSERTEAMKVLLPTLEGDTELADRFLREIKVQAALDHPNIAKLNTASRISNQLIMIMEFVDGTSVEKLLEKGPMTVSEAAGCAGQVLDALAYAHAHGVVHRDIKPANIMITPGGRAKLMDFGIAGVKAEKRLTQTGRTVGSLYYMSPEQIQGLQPDPRSDLYSLGVTLYEMVTGKRPFQGDSDYQIMAAHLQQVPAPPIEMMPGLPDALNEIIVTAISKDAAERFQSADAFHAALRTVLAAANPAATTVVRPALQNVSAASAPTVIAAPRIPPQSAPTLVTPQVSPAVNPSTLIAPPPLPAFGAVPRAANVPAPPVAARPSVAVPPSISAPPAAAVPPGPPGSRRGLYMALGSVATLLALAAAVIEGPKFFGAGAQTGAQTAVPAPAVPTQPASATAQTPAPPVPPQQSGPQNPVNVSPESTSPERPATRQVVIQQRTPVQPPPGAVISAPSAPPSLPPLSTGTGTVSTRPVVIQTAAPQTPAAQPASAQPPPVPPSVAAQPPPQAPPAQSAAQAAAAAQMNELREKFNLLSVRAGTAKAGLRSLEQQMARQGLGLRADIKEAEGRMDYLMTEASSSIRRGDSEAADRNLQMAERALGTIEKFQGR